MKLIPLFLSQSKSLDSSSKLIPFPSCGYLNTLSFRDDNNFRTFNSAFLDTTISSSSSSSLRFSTLMSEEDPIDHSFIQGLKSDRLFFHPEHSSTLVSTPDNNNNEYDNDPSLVYKESEAMSMESSSPCDDFRRSMEEMVEAHGLKDWQGLEELLGCYLKINDEINHGFIMVAFIDLLVNISFISTSASSTTTTTTTTTTTATTTNNSSSSNSSSNTTSSSSLLSSHNNHLICSSSPSSPLSFPSSWLLATPLSSILDHGDDYCCNRDDDDNDDVDDIR